MQPAGGHDSSKGLSPVDRLALAGRCPAWLDGPSQRNGGTAALVRPSRRMAEIFSNWFLHPAFMQRAEGRGDAEPERQTSGLAGNVLPRRTVRHHRSYDLLHQRAADWRVHAVNLGPVARQVQGAE